MLTEDTMQNDTGFFKQVYSIVSKIPQGKVATYGQIALILGKPRGARAVGWAMRCAPQQLGLACHRVVNSKGTLSPFYVFGDSQIQKQLLSDEGITFTQDGRINMKKHLWNFDSTDL